MTTTPESTDTLTVARNARTSIIEAEFIRVPPPRGRCAITGLSRTSFIELITTPGTGIIVKRLRKRGAVRGIVLVEKNSLTTYLHSLPSA